MGLVISLVEIGCCCISQFFELNQKPDLQIEETKRKHPKPSETKRNQTQTPEKCPPKTKK